MTFDTNRNWNEDMLEAIEQLFQEGEREDALELLDDYLAAYPHDLAAELMKVEFCLTERCNATYIGLTLRRLAQEHPDSERVRALCQTRDECVRDRLAEARRELSRGRLDDGIETLDTVLALAPDEPGLGLASAHILLTAEDDDDAPLAFLERLQPRRTSRTVKGEAWRAAAVKYLYHALQGSSPGDALHLRAAERLVRLFLDAEAIDKALEIFESGATIPESLANEVAQNALAMALATAAVLLSCRELDAANALLAACHQAAPELPMVHLLIAEGCILAKHHARAQASYRKALRCAKKPPASIPLTLAKVAWEQARDARLTCGQCGMQVEPHSDQCHYCGAAISQEELLLERYELADVPDAAAARVGLAVLLSEQGDFAGARKQLGAALKSIPEDHASRERLENLQRQWEASDEPGATTSPALAVLFEKWQREGLTPDVLGEVVGWCRSASREAWSTVALRARAALARALIDAEQFQAARSFLDTAFADNPRRKTVAHLQTRLADVVAAWAARRLAEARQALRSAAPETAAGLAGEILAIEPGFVPARLLRGQAHLTAGNIVPALDDFRKVIATASDPDLVRTAKLGAAQVLEAAADYQGAQSILEGVSGAEASKVRARLARRQRGEPIIRLVRSSSIVLQDTLSRTRTRPFYYGYFAVMVGAVSRPWQTGLGDWTAHILKAGYEFVQALGGLSHADGDPVVALRLLSQPDPNIAERGRLTAAFIVRVSAQSEKAARDLAHGYWLTLKTMLPAGHEHVYAYEPVSDEDVLDTLLRPFKPVSVAEIVRREEVPQQDGERYAVYRFTPGSLDLHSLCWTLLRQPAAAMVSIHLVPTALLAWEQATFDRLMLGEKDPVSVQERSEAVDDLPDQVSLWWQATAQLGPAQANRHVFEALRTRSYLLRVSVASDAGNSPLLAEMTAAGLFGPPTYSHGTSYGGYEIVHANTVREKAIARRNLLAVDVEQWVYSAAPNGAARLRHLVGEEEAVSAFRLPIPGREGVPGMPLIDTKPVAPPPGLPVHGTVLGVSVLRAGGSPLRVTQAPDDRRRHTYIVGRTGTGKTTLIQNLVLQDIEAGHGVCVIDPHGDLIEDVLARVPAHRAQDVVLFDPSDEARPIGLNLLDAQDETAKQRVTTEFIGLLTRMYDPHNQGIVGPRFQHNVRHAMLTAMCVEGSTLIEVVRVLTDFAYVKRILPNVKDPLLRRYWTDQIANTTDYHKSEILDYIVSKFSRFIGDSRVRNIVGQRSTTLDFRQIMDQRKILLVNLSKGKIGPESSQFLGLLLVQGLLITALSRGDRSVDQRPDFFLYVDEFQNFATDLFASMLSEGRKYGIVATVANQYLTQLPQSIREAIFGNVGSLISFRLGTQDALALHQEMLPLLGADDLLNLPKFTACVKLLVDGVATRPFTMRTLPDTRVPDAARANQIREASRQLYGRDGQAVTDEIFSRYS